ncbi:MAG: hypothetical protein JWR38_5007 [Mucilaginibacter sp.]|nr:hypothetical protein [Mucilaginibacter sp.]
MLIISYKAIANIYSDLNKGVSNWFTLYLIVWAQLILQ